MIDYHALPAVNAMLNGTSALLLLAGFGFIRAQRVTAHKLCMTTAFVTSMLFLVSYLTYHAHVGSVRFPSGGVMRVIYLSILVSHTILAVAMVPLVLRTLYLALWQRFTAHRAIARWTWPLWLYVSVTGVIIYWLLYHSRWGI